MSGFNFDVITLFPKAFELIKNFGVITRALEKNLVDVNLYDLREYGEGSYRQVDDKPYGGGAGMVLKPEPIFRAVQHLTEQTASSPRVILMCPQGERFTQKKAEELSKEEHLIFICGHYEGYDERIRENLITDEISIGDFVLTGGELGAMVVTDSVVRLLPEVLGNEDSAVKDSFSSGLLEHPHYTRPADYEGMKVPEVLLSGNHAKIEDWRMKESLRRTYMRRPDLLDEIELNDQQLKWLKEFKNNIE